MSINAEILQSAEVVDANEISKQVPDLKNKLEKLQIEVIDNFENVYVKFSTRNKFKLNRTLKKALDIRQVLGNLKQKSDFILNQELVKTKSELNKNISDLESLDCELEILLSVLEILELTHDFDLKLAMQNYLKCAEIVKEWTRRMYCISEEKLEIAVELKFILIKKESNFQTHLKSIVTENIFIKEELDEDTVSLVVKKFNSDQIKLALEALFYSHETIDILHELAKSLWELIFVPVVKYKVRIDEINENDVNTITLHIIDRTQKSPKVVISNLKHVVQYLVENFNFIIGQEFTTLEHIGADIRDNLSELIIKNCLRDTIPSTKEELQIYKVEIECVGDLEQALLDAKIFKEDTCSLLAYVKNVDALFIDKKCQNYLEVGQNIMKKDLHDMVEVGTPYDPQQPLGRELDDFPQCSISKNVQELLSLANSILKEAINEFSEHADQLFSTAENLFVRYHHFVPEFYQNYLHSLPQQVALFHNNCLYIAHVLGQWNIQYCLQLKSKVGLCNFTDEAAKLTKVAVETLSKCMQGQVKQTNEIMSGAYLDGTTLEKLNPMTEKCVRQCLRQQELLKTVWHKVLSYTVYNKNIGILVDELCKYLIKSSVKFEDIPAEVAKQMADVLKLIQTRAPKLFTNPNEIVLYVPSWYKFNELHFILNASLVDICHRWADGKGPLALQFECDELKQLIEALFQNTDRRAVVLSKIQESNVKNN